MKSLGVGREGRALPLANKVCTQRLGGCERFAHKLAHNRACLWSLLAARGARSDATPPPRCQVAPLGDTALRSIRPPLSTNGNRPAVRPARTSSPRRGGLL